MSGGFGNVEMKAPAGKSGTELGKASNYAIYNGIIQADKRDFKDLVAKGYIPTDPVLAALLNVGS